MLNKLPKFKVDVSFVRPEVHEYDYRNKWLFSTPKSEGGIEKKKKHRKRKGKLPKNYNASIPPDPERWLPKYERTGYRKKRDRRVKEVIKGSQGTASGQAEQYDFSSKVTEQQEPDSPAVDPSPRAKSHHQQKKVQKKKGKRR